MKSSWFKVGIPLLLAVLLFGSMLAAGVGAVAKDDGIEKAKKIAKKVEKDLKETGKYSEEDLEKLILVLAQVHKLALGEEEKKAAKDYALHEIKKKIRLEKLKKNTISRTTVKPEKIISQTGTAYEIATSGPISTFFQPIVDITGGSGYDDNGNFYNVEGNNDLYLVEVEQVYLYGEDTYCPVNGLAELYTMYTMYYYDEDHRDPSWDAYYDDLRRVVYGRIEELKLFT